MKLACFLNCSKTKIDRKRLSKSCYSTRVQLVKRISVINRKDLSISCLLMERASILEQASRSYGRLTLGGFF